jgi:DNA helicase-2/ATP-dependent DNA helicase PcrA
LPFEPTDEQELILGHDPVHHGVVLAGPGTGKSATVVALIERLAARDQPPRVKLLTFTRAATSELAKKVSEHPQATAERPSTIHSFAISILLRNPGSANFPLPLRMADDWETENIVRPTLATRMGVGLKAIDRLLREMEANWQSLRLQDDPRLAPDVRARFLGVWREHREVYGYTLLAELPELLRQALRAHDDLQGLQYDLLIVDEYQDLNACDIEVLHRLSERSCAVLAAGDDDQSIYSFRKAAPEGIRRFGQDYPESTSYPLTITKRCGRSIVAWARFVIEGDPDRPHDRNPLTPDAEAPDGECALLAFSGHNAEAAGVAAIVAGLVRREGVPPGEIVVLFRGDRAGLFSGPIKERLTAEGIAVADPDLVKRALAEDDNRRAIATFRLLVSADDSLAWATLLKLTDGIGAGFLDYIYERAGAARTGLGTALLEAHDAAFPEAPRASATAATPMIRAVREWLEAHPPPEAKPGEGWGHFLVGAAGGGVVPLLSADLAEIVSQLDEVAEGEDLGRFLSQIAPLGTDLALARQNGVRFMTMAGSKGLTVQAAIVAACEEGIVPRPAAELAEERRLLYVAMTRARRFAYCTWARRRQGPTARAGATNVGARRTPCSFLNGGPVETQDGDVFIRDRWR